MGPTLFYILEMSSYLCIKITKAKADICFAQKDVNPFSFFLFCLEEKLKQKKKTAK